MILTKRPNLKKLVGIEFSKEQLDMVKKLPKTEYHERSVFDIQLEEKFNCVFSVFVLEHFKNEEELQKFVDNCKKVLKDHGQILIIAVDTNVGIRTPKFQDYAEYKVHSEKELEDGEHFKVEIGAWSNIDTRWSLEYLCKLFDKNGFETRVEFVEQDIITEKYSAEEKKEIEEGRFLYALRATLI